jgi:murein DD-endopeptidase MepM/ murein hydrolase activator NlpD
MKQNMKNSKFCIRICNSWKLSFYITFVILSVHQSFSQQLSESVVGCFYTESVMEELNSEVESSIRQLRSEGKLDFTKYKTAEEDLENSADAKMLTAIQMQWPLTSKEYSDFPVWSIGNFYDQEYFSDGDDDVDEAGEIEDYNCGDRTYDGHRGYDINAEPYKWKAQFDGSVYIVAAAPGIIVNKVDGEPDENCEWDSTITATRGNHIVVLLEDGNTATFYMHMRNGSLTEKEEGDYVTTGEYLGTVASSGRSTGPHLHFQVNTGYYDYGVGAADDSGADFDIFDGECNSLYPYADAVFENQPPYDDPAVLTLETHSSNPGTYDADFCDKTIGLFNDNSFTGTTTVWFRSKLRDFIDGAAVSYAVYRPSGTAKLTYFRYDGSGRNEVVDDQSATFTVLDPAGTYRYTATFGGKTYSHYFAYNCLSTQTLSGSVSGHKGNMVSNSITSTQTISSSSSNYIKYMADEFVQLNIGFSAAAGCKFVANLEGCNNSTALMEEDWSLKTVEDQFYPECTLYPNPTNGAFELYYYEEADFEALLTIRDHTGRMLLQVEGISSMNEIRIPFDLSTYPKGVYYVELRSNQRSVTKPIVLQ